MKRKHQRLVLGLAALAAIGGASGLALSALESEPAPVPADDEARIAALPSVEAVDEMLTGFIDYGECDSMGIIVTLRRVLDERDAMLREFAAGKAKAEAEVQRLWEEAQRFYRADGGFDVLPIDEVVARRKAAAKEIADLRAKLATAPKETRVMQVTQTGEHFCETQCDVRKDYRSGSAKLVTKVAAMEADLADLRAENARLQTELAAARAENEQWPDQIAAALNSTADKIGRTPSMIAGHVRREHEEHTRKDAMFRKACDERDAARAENERLRADQSAVARRELEAVMEEVDDELVNACGRHASACGKRDGLRIAFRSIADRLAALPQPKPAAEPVPAFDGDPKDSAFLKDWQPQVAPVALEVVAEKAAEWLTLCSHNDDKDSGTHSKVAHDLRAAIRPATGNMHPVLYWLDDGKFARAMLVGKDQLVVDLTTGDGPSVIGKPDWWEAGYVAAYGGLVPECSSEGKEPGQWSYGVAQLPPYTPAQQQTLTAAIPPLPIDEGRVAETVEAAGDAVRDAHDRVFLAALMDWLIDNPGMDPARTLHAISTKVLARRALAGKEPKP